MRLVITYLNGPSQGRDVVVDNFPARIGKNCANCSIPLNDRDAGATVADIVNTNDSLVLRSERQDCRIELNGRRVAAGKGRALRTGDVIETGRTLLLVGLNERASGFSGRRGGR